MKTLLIFFTLLNLTCFSQVNLPNDTLKNQRLRLKNYAFCSCIYSLNKEDSQMVVKDGSITGYFEIADYGLSAYKIIDALAKKYALKKYSSKYGRSLGLMKCLDFYNSKQLAFKIKSLDSLLTQN